MEQDLCRISFLVGPTQGIQKRRGFAFVQVTAFQIQDIIHRTFSVPNLDQSIKL